MASMTSTASTSTGLGSWFLALPGEIRDLIYDYSIGWPDLNSLFERIASEQQPSDGHNAFRMVPLCTVPRPHFDGRRTPSILLVNKQIAAEAQAFLLSKPWILRRTPPYIPQLATPMDIIEFISEPTLQNLRFVVLVVDVNNNGNLVYGSAKFWLKTVEMLLDIWCVKNCLVRVVVQAHYVVPSQAAGWTFGQAAQQKNAMKVFSMLRGFGEQVHMVFEGEINERRMVLREANRELQGSL